MQGLTVSGILLNGAWPCILLPREVSLPFGATCSWAVAGWRQKRKHTCIFLSSTAARVWPPDSCDLSCSPLPHTWGCANVTGENKPHSRAKLLQSPTSPRRVSFKGSAQWTSVTLKQLQWTKVVGEEEEEVEKKNTNCTTTEKTQN